MSAALRYEWVRLRTLRSTWWLLGLAVALHALVAFAVASAAADSTELQGAELTTLVMTGGARFAPIPLQVVLVALVSVFALGHEYRHGTIRASLTAIPRRSAFLAAKVLVCCGWAVIIAVGLLAVGYVAAALRLGWRWSDVPLFSGDTGRVLLGFVVFTVVWTVIGLAVAGLFRNLPAGITVLLVVPLIVEPVITAVLYLVDALDPLEGLIRFLPFGAGQQLLSLAGDVPGEVADAAAPPVFGPLGGGLVFATFAAVLLAVTWALFEKRDA